MWKRAFASWDGKTSDTVGIHCNFQYTQAADFIHAPYSILRKNEDESFSLVDGAPRAGFVNFFHATTGQFFTLYDDAFVPMVEDIEDSAPTGSDPSPALWVPNKAGWLTEYGADPYTDAFGEARYRNNLAVILNWNGKNADSGGNKQWSADRLVIVAMTLNTDALDLAEVAYKCKVNRT
jgi:hypothetical protein